MRFKTTFISAICIGILAACSTPAEKASKAREESYKALGGIATQRLELVEKYQACVKKASGNAQKIEACDSYLKAAQALR